MCTNPITIKTAPSAMDLYKGISSQRELQVPCGKCHECLKKRQNDLMIRVYEEAKDKGCAVFVTLTYAPKHEPVAQSLWAVDKDSGEFERVFEPVLIEDKPHADIVRGRFCTSGVRIDEEYLDIPDDKYLYVHRYTPSLNYNDVQLALKRFRKNNPDLPDFTYVFVGEYGMNKFRSMRPHYHCIFFGLQKNQVQKFCDEWRPDLSKPFNADIHSLDNNAYGYVNIKQVTFINSDKTDGLAKVARYVGKYCAKGKYDVCTKRDGLTLRTRLCVSKGLGLSCEFKGLRNHFLALDEFKYNPEDISKVPQELLDKICEKIVSRLFYNFNSFPYALPNSFKRYVFGWRKVRKYADLPAMFKYSVFGQESKAVYSPIFYAVADFVRNRYIQEDSQEFEKYRVRYASEGLSFACCEFERNKQACLQIRDENAELSILQFYRKHSKL